MYHRSSFFKRQISRMGSRSTVNKPLLLLLSILCMSATFVDSHLHDIIKGMDVSAEGTVVILSRFFILLSDNKGLDWNLLGVPNSSGGEEFTEIVLSPAFDEDQTIFFGGKYWSNDGGVNWQVFKSLDHGDMWNSNPCAWSRSDAITFHPHYNHKEVTERRKMVMMATTRKVWVSDDGGAAGFRKLGLSASIDLEFAKESSHKCPMLATIGSATYLTTPSMAVFKTTDFGETWSDVLPADDELGEVTQIQVDRTTANSLLLVTLDNVYRMTLPSSSSSTPILVPTVLPERSPDSDIFVVGTHNGAGEESSAFISRSRCSGKQAAGVRECRNTSQDKLAVSHTFKGSSPEWNEMKINDYFAFDRGSQPSSCFNMPEFSHIRGVPGTSTVYVGTYSGIYRSDDGGDSWLELDTIANIATTLAISPAKNDGGNIALVTTCTYSGGCFLGEVNVTALENNDAVRVADMEPESCLQATKKKNIPPQKQCLDKGRYSVSVRSPSFGTDQIALRIEDEPKIHARIQRSTNDFADIDGVDTVLETKIDAEECERTGICSPSFPGIRVIKYSPNFKRDGTVFVAGVQGLWSSTDEGLTFTRKSGIPRALGEQCKNCNMTTTGWTGRDIVSLAFSPHFKDDETMVAVSQTSSTRADKHKRYISVSTDSGGSWTDMIDKRWIVHHRFWTSAVITDGPNSAAGLTVVGTMSSLGHWRDEDTVKYDQIYVNQFGEAPYNNVTWTSLKYRKQGNPGLEQGGFSGYGVAVLPTGEYAAFLWSGGMIIGNVRRDKAKINNLRKYATPRLGGDSNLPGSANEKSINEMVMVSPDRRHNGVIFGVDKQKIYASVNKGETWQEVLSIPYREPRVGSEAKLGYALCVLPTDQLDKNLCIC